MRRVSFAFHWAIVQNLEASYWAVGIFSLEESPPRKVVDTTKWSLKPTETHVSVGGHWAIDYRSKWFIGMKALWPLFRYQMECQWSVSLPNLRHTSVRPSGDFKNLGSVSLRFSKVACTIELVRGISTALTKPFVSLQQLRLVVW